MFKTKRKLKKENEELKKMIEVYEKRNYGLVMYPKSVQVSKFFDKKPTEQELEETKEYLAKRLGETLLQNGFVEIEYNERNLYRRYNSLVMRVRAYEEEDRLRVKNIALKGEK